ncbi:hypothetical protein J6590_039536 [Homalodisca vitripennis]|nr:hypothetical protein J6590_039536 [Homalodisca vitripennis]
MGAVSCELIREISYYCQFIGFLSFVPLPHLAHNAAKGYYRLRSAGGTGNGKIDEGPYLNERKYCNHSPTTFLYAFLDNNKNSNFRMYWRASACVKAAVLLSPVRFDFSIGILSRGRLLAGVGEPYHPPSPHPNYASRLLARSVTIVNHNYSALLQNIKDEIMFTSFA